MQKLKQREIALLVVRLERLIYLLMVKLEIQTKSEILLTAFYHLTTEIKKLTANDLYFTI